MGQAGARRVDGGCRDRGRKDFSKSEPDRKGLGQSDLPERGLVRGQGLLRKSGAGTHRATRSAANVREVVSFEWRGELTNLISAPPRLGADDRTIPGLQAEPRASGERPLHPCDRGCSFCGTTTVREHAGDRVWRYNSARRLRPWPPCRLKTSIRRCATCIGQRRRRPLRVEPSIAPCIGSWKQPSKKRSRWQRGSRSQTSCGNLNAI